MNIRWTGSGRPDSGVFEYQQVTFNRALTMFQTSLQFPQSYGKGPKFTNCRRPTSVGLFESAGHSVLCATQDVWRADNFEGLGTQEGWGLPVGERSQYQGFKTCAPAQYGMAVDSSNSARRVDPQLDSVSISERNSFEARPIYCERWWDHHSLKRGCPGLKLSFPHDGGQNCEGVANSGIMLDGARQGEKKNGTVLEQA